MVFTSENRPIGFPLDRSLNPEVVDSSIVTNTPFAWSTLDNDELVTITMTLSLREFIVLSSAIDVGSDIAYGDDAINVWILWLRAVNSMALCDQIAACIANDTGVQNALLNYLSGTGVGGIGSGGVAGAGSNTTIVLTQNTDDIMSGGACSNDNMYAVATRIAELAFDTVNQLYQVLDLAISPLELATELADNAPAVVSAIPATAGDWVVWIQDTANDAWNVYDSPTKRIEVACDIFCIMVDNNCVLTFDDLFSYFASKSDINPIGKTLEEYLVGMISVSPPNEVGTISLALLFGMLALGAKVAGVTNVGGFLTTIAAYIDETNNNWTLECDPCTPPPTGWCFTVDFTTQGIGQWCLLNGLAPSANGIESTYINGLSENAKVAIDLGENNILSEVMVEWKYDQAPSGANDKIYAQMMDGTTGCDGNNRAYTNPTTWHVFTPPGDTNINSATWNASSSANRRFIGIQIFDYNNGVPSCYIRKITIKGTGSTPSLITSNC